MEEKHHSVLSLAHYRTCMWDIITCIERTCPTSINSSFVPVSDLLFDLLLLLFPIVFLLFVPGVNKDISRCGSNGCGSLRINTDQYGLIRVNTDEYGSIRMNTDQYG